ncbi:MAG: CHAD domain-containing protein [Alphaproteobacteria bacterium]|nr:CHAD domain-containing protein [Alphaproteobacteria bacterium]
MFGLRGNLASDRKVADAYFDTPRCTFYKQDITFKMRTEGRVHTQTISQRQPASAPIRWTTCLQGQGRALVLNDTWAMDLGLKRNAAPPSRRIFTANITQRRLALARKKSQFMLTTHTGEICSAGPVFKYVAEPLSDIELVPVKGSQRALFDFALELLEAHKIRFQPDTVASRGFALASASLQKKHSKAQKVSLDPLMSVGAVLETIIQSNIRHLLSNQTAALRGDVNGVHQTRVAMRRLRAALRAFKTVLPYEGRKAFNGELRWYQQRTGPTRDWHVFTDETLDRLKPGDVSAGELAILRKLAAQKGQMHGRQAAALLQGRRYTRMLLRLGRWIAGLLEEGHDSELWGPVLPFAGKTLGKTHRDLLREIARARPGSMEDMHKVRLRGKKARYTGEFFSALFEPEDAQAYVQTVERLQDRLGAANDARVARGLVMELEHGKLKPETFYGIQAWSHRRVSRCLDQAQPVLQMLQSADVFWNNG